jgi:hypothetical protein
MLGRTTFQDVGLRVLSVCTSVSPPVESRNSQQNWEHGKWQKPEFTPIDTYSYIHKVPLMASPFIWHFANQ